MHLLKDFLLPSPMQKHGEDQLSCQMTQVPLVERSHAKSTPGEGRKPPFARRAKIAAINLS
jgi:hypothetical protein